MLTFGSVYVCVCAHMYVCLYACVYSCMCNVCLRVCIHVDVCTPLCVHAYMCVVCACMYMCALCVCVYACMHACMYSCEPPHQKRTLGVLFHPLLCCVLGTVSHCSWNQPGSQETPVILLPPAPWCWDFRCICRCPAFNMVGRIINTCACTASCPQVEAARCHLQNLPPTPKSFPTLTISLNPSLLNLMKRS